MNFKKGIKFLKGLDKFLKTLKDVIDGNKTYVTAFVIVIIGILMQAGYEIPNFVWVALNAAGFASLRHGIKKAEKKNKSDTPS